MVKRANPDALKKIADRLPNVKAQVGFFDSARYFDGTPVAYIAAIQEFGYPAGNIPMRSFMRTTNSDQKKSWAQIIRNGAKAVITGDDSLQNVMERVGLKAAGDMRKKISQITEPKLKESTVKARQRRGNSNTKPLVDTRILINSLNHVVETK